MLPSPAGRNGGGGVCAAAYAALYGGDRQHSRCAGLPATRDRDGVDPPCRGHGPRGGIPPAGDRHGRHGSWADRPLRTVRVRPLRH